MYSGRPVRTQQTSGTATESGGGIRLWDVAMSLHDSYSG